MYTPLRYLLFTFHRQDTKPSVALCAHTTPMRYLSLGIQYIYFIASRQITERYPKSTQSLHTNQMEIQFFTFSKRKKVPHARK